MTCDSGDVAQHGHCDACGNCFLLRPVGDMADLNNLCESCAAECAAQLSRDYNLPLGCPDEERQAAMNPPAGGTLNYFECFNTSCSRCRKPWSTPMTYAEWRAKYKSWPHCFSCGAMAIYLGAYTPSEAPSSPVPPP